MATMNAELKTETGKGVARRLRVAGRVPAVVYGDSKDPIMVSLDPRDVNRSLQVGGFFANTLDLVVDGESHKVLPRAVQFHKVTDAPIHVDFMRVSRNTKITVQVPVRFVNELASPGLKRGAVLNVVRSSIEVVCTQETLPSSFNADLTGLNVNDAIKVSAIEIPEGVITTINDRDFVIATVTAPSALKRQMADEAKAGGSEEAAE